MKSLTLKVDPLTDDLPNLIDDRDTPSLNHFV